MGVGAASVGITDIGGADIVVVAIQVRIESTFAASAMIVLGTFVAVVACGGVIYGGRVVA